MANAFGFVELPNLADAVTVLDIMLKTSDINLAACEKRLGGRLVTLIIEGSISSVQNAVDAAKACGQGKIAASAVIGNPHPETVKMVRLSGQSIQGEC